MTGQDISFFSLKYRPEGMKEVDSCAKLLTAGPQPTRNGECGWGRTAACMFSASTIVCAVCLVSWKGGDTVVASELTNNSNYPRFNLCRRMLD